MVTLNKKSLKSYYQELFHTYGDSPHSVQHVSKAAQNVRFLIFINEISKTSSVVDLGCGLGDMLEYFRSNGFEGEYLGLDFVPEFINTAKQKFSNDSKARFEEFDIYHDPFPEGIDHVLISGVFNNKIEDNLSFLRLAISKSFASCNKSVIFNALTSYVEYEDPILFYVNPLSLFDEFKRSLTPLITLKHDYVTKENGFPYEFTMCLIKGSTR